MATSIDQSDFVKTALRLPPSLHAAVHAAAKRSGRSFNAELLDLIDQGLSSKEAPSLAPILARLERALSRAERSAATARHWTHDFASAVAALTEALPRDAPVAVGSKIWMAGVLHDHAKSFAEGTAQAQEQALAAHEISELFEPAGASPSSRTGGEPTNSTE